MKYIKGGKLHSTFGTTLWTSLIVKRVTVRLFMSLRRKEAS